MELNLKKVIIIGLAIFFVVFVIYTLGNSMSNQV